MSLDGVVDSLWEAWELPASDGGEEAEAYTEFEKTVRVADSWSRIYRISVYCRSTSFPWLLRRIRLLG